MTTKVELKSRDWYDSVTHKKQAWSGNQPAVRCRHISGEGKEQLYGVPALLVKLKAFKS